MADIEIVRTADMIAGEINYIKQKARERLLLDSIEIGRRLAEAKNLVGHGQWSEWLDKNVQYSQSTAENLMRISEEYGSEQVNLFTGRTNSETFANLSYSQAVALFAVPAEQRAEFVEHHDMDTVSIRELQEEIAREKKLREDAENRAANARELLRSTSEKKDSAQSDLLREAKAREKAQDEARKLREEADKAKQRLAAIEKEKQEIESRFNDTVEQLQEKSAEIAELAAREPSQPQMTEDTGITEETLRASVEAAVKEARDKARQEIAAEYDKKTREILNSPVSKLNGVADAISAEIKRASEVIAMFPEDKQTLAKNIITDSIRRILSASAFSDIVK